MRRFGIVLSSLGFLAIALAIAHHFIAIEVNVTESLPQRFFLVLKNQPVTKGDYVAFYAKHNGVYPTHIPFIKKVGGIAGERVSQKNRVFFIDEHKIGKAKEKAKTGMRLEAGPTGVIKENHYFVYSEHKDSFDSRYQNIGWVKKEDSIGKAIPLF